MKSFLVKRVQAFVLIAVFSAASSLAPAHAGTRADFFRAVKVDDAGAVHALLARGFDVNARDAHGDPALLVAVRDHADKVVQLLLDSAGIDVDAANRAGDNALMLACLHGDDALVRQMIDEGASVDKPGWTPLAYAATDGHAAIARSRMVNVSSGTIDFSVTS